MAVDTRTVLRLVAVLLAALILAPAASAVTLVGDVRPRHRNWVREARQQMPVAKVTLRLNRAGCPFVGGACYDDETRELYLPLAGRGGWTYWDERVLFLHELGHAADLRHLNRAERSAFRAAVGTDCSWWSTRCPNPSAGEGEKLPPGERFAEMYAACALGMTREQVDAVPSVSYGWDPDPALDQSALCRQMAGWIRH